jgi:hypothetical protein
MVLERKTTPHDQILGYSMHSGTYFFRKQVPIRKRRAYFPYISPLFEVLHVVMRRN